MFKKIIHCLSVSLISASILFSATAGFAAEVPTAGYTQQDLNEQNVMSLLWMQTSAEYRELCYQAYNMAKMQVDLAVKNKQSTDKPLAIIVDCDETIIDNSDCDAGYIGHNEEFSNATWTKWVAAARADAMPGSVNCLNYIADKGIEIFYVTNRDAKTCKEGTMKNLQELGLPMIDEQHVLLQTETGNKQPRFDQVAKNYNVVIYMGDNANDLPLDTYGQNMQQRNAAIDKNANMFGSRFIALPNPSYGDWEGALDANYRHLNPEQKDAVRKSMLNSWHPDTVNQ